MTHSEWPGYTPAGAVYVDYNRVYDIVRGFEDRMRRAQPEVVVGILRGGAIPAAMAANRLGLPLTFVDYHRARSHPILAAPAQIEGKSVLLVDDFASTGATLETVREHLAPLAGRLTTCTLFFDPQRSGIAPDIGHPAERFILFPWERKDVSEGTREILRASGGKIQPGQEVDSVAVDLDGVLVPDVRRRWYRKKELQSILAFRDALRQADRVPHGARTGAAAVITARPEEDRHRTERWLRENGFGGLRLICRDRSIYGDSTDEMARYKSERIRELGVTMFFESDLRQAIEISKRCPATDVIWWGKNDKVRLSASAFDGDPGWAADFANNRKPETGA